MEGKVLPFYRRTKSLSGLQAGCRLRPLISGEAEYLGAFCRGGVLFDYYRLNLDGREYHVIKPREGEE